MGRFRYAILSEDFIVIISSFTDNNRQVRAKKFSNTIAHDKDIDIATVSKLVGHKKIDTTMRYYTKISLSKKGDELKKFELPEPDDEENEESSK